MLTIGRLASYAGVTVATVRHYHRIGLLPEPGRDRSGYRSYDAAAVVRLIRIHILAAAGVPLAQVEDLLDADPATFAERVRELDERLRAEIRRVQETRERLARLAAGEHLALPASVVGYLDRLRDLGVEEPYIELERDAWIMVAAQLPEQIDAIMARKHADLDDPDLVRFYSLVSGALEWPEDDPRVVEAADILSRLLTRAAEAGGLNQEGLDEPFAELLDVTMAESAPAAQRLLALMEERGWKGWTRFERVGDGDGSRDDGRG